MTLLPAERIEAVPDRNLMKIKNKAILIREDAPAECKFRVENNL